MKRYLAYLLLPFLLLGCGGGADDDEANFRFINALTDASGIDLYIDDEEYRLGLGYSEETGYGFIEDDSHEFLVTIAGQFTSLGTIRATIDSGIDYSLILVGAPLNARGLFLKDNNEEPTENSVKVRLVNGLLGGTVDVYVTEASAPLAGAIPSIDGANFGEVSSYLISRPGTYRVRVTGRRSAVVIADSGPMELSDGEIWTAVLSRQRSVNSGEVLWYRDRG